MNIARVRHGVAGLLVVALGGCVQELPSPGDLENATSPIEAADVGDKRTVEEVPEKSIPPSTLTSPPFDGTVYVTALALTPESPSDLVNISFAVVDSRETFDRRVDDWVVKQSWVYQASYRCGRPLVDIVVNQEFTRDQADAEAERFAYVLGQIPAGVRTNVDELWIHPGQGDAGGGNRSILIHTDGVDLEWEYIEEIFLHEAAHTSLDPDFLGAVDPALWRKAQSHDMTFISTYAEDNPEREDIAESYGAYYIWALHRDSGLFSAEAELISAAIPGRIAYFESLGPQFGPSLSPQCD